VKQYVCIAASFEIETTYISTMVSTPMALFNSLFLQFNNLMPAVITTDSPQHTEGYVISQKKGKKNTILGKTFFKLAS